jgi:hypothetical protein
LKQNFRIAKEIVSVCPVLLVVLAIQAAI